MFQFYRNTPLSKKIILELYYLQKNMIFEGNIHGFMNSIRRYQIILRVNFYLHNWVSDNPMANLIQLLLILKFF